jgi:hypothetical protein
MEGELLGWRQLQAGVAVGQVGDGDLGFQLAEVGTQATGAGTGPASTCAQTAPPEALSRGHSPACLAAAPSVTQCQLHAFQRVPGGTRTMSEGLPLG